MGVRGEPQSGPCPQSESSSADSHPDADDDPVINKPTVPISDLASPLFQVPVPAPDTDVRAGLIRDFILEIALSCVSDG